MAKGNAVWGIDIGQCSLKALRCVYDSRGKLVVSDACDFIEYEKILSQPDADPEQLVRDAIKEFLSRNSVRGDKVAISVAGQQGLARFIKLPPVEAKKLPKIVEFEAKQQIPFALEDVIWDYQMLVGGVDSEGMALENEVGLFAMKRDQVFRAIRPLDDAGIEIDFIQLSPACVFNAAVHSVMGDLPPLSEYDPDNPPESIVVLSMGTDTTDLVVTNGYRVWQRSIPLGGNHFTKQLTKELKLTFGKAEHLKRNSREAEDPKKVFQAMRPVFNDLVTEIQRSIGYFESLDRTATIGRIIGMGNAFKLPGLEPYLEKNLGHKVEVLSSFDQLSGPATEDPKFKSNAQSMGVCYGLALQGVGQAKLRTNLVPRELLRARMIREKKPWVLAAASLLLAGFAANFVFHNLRTQEVAEDHYAQHVTKLNSVSSRSSSFKNQDQQYIDQFAKLKSVGDQVVGNSERRFQMMELMKAIDAALPREQGLKPGQVSERPLDAKTPAEQREELFIETMDMKFYGGEDNPIAGDEGWFTEAAKNSYASTLLMLKDLEAGGGKEPARDVVVDGEEGADAEAGADDLADADLEEGEDGTDPELEAAAAEITDPEGSGWVIELSGYHFHNLRYPMAGSEYVRRTLVKNLMSDDIKVRLPVGGGAYDDFTMKELGISHALIAEDGGINRQMKILNPDWEPPRIEDFDEDPALAAQAVFGAPQDDKKKKPEVPQFLKPRTHRFKVHFLWRPTRLSERLEARQMADEGNTDNQLAEGDN